MAQQSRVMLINPSGRKLIKSLSEKYPEYMWVLTMKEDKEVCVGIKDGVPAVFGTDYDMIVFNL
jgi:hypothetical protein